MTLQEAQSYDTLLGQLNRDGRRVEINVPKRTELSEQWIYLESEELVDLITGGGKIVIAKLTPKGISFITSGGFEKQLRDAIKEDQRKKKANKIAIWSIAITALLSLLAIWQEELRQAIAWMLSLVF